MIARDWISPLEPIFEKVEYTVEWYAYPTVLMLRGIFHVNLSLLRRFYPYLTILYNYDLFEDELPSPSVKFQRIPISYELYNGAEALFDDGTPSYVIDGKTFDPFWLESVVMGKVALDSHISLSPIFLLSSDDVDISGIEEVVHGVGDINQLWEALLEHFSVAVYFHGYATFSVITKDPEIVSFLEQAPKGRLEAPETNEE